MRMPIFSYFLVVGSVLTGLLVWFGDDRELASAPLKASQAIGVPTPFKGKPDSRPEAMPDLTNVNFAAARERPAAERERAREKSAKVAAEPKPRQKTVVRTWQQLPARSWFAEYPQTNWITIH
jgi:hypothetical protein